MGGWGGAFPNWESQNACLREGGRVAGLSARWLAHLYVRVKVGAHAAGIAIFGFAPPIDLHGVLPRKHNPEAGKRRPRLSHLYKERKGGPATC